MTGKGVHCAAWTACAIAQRWSPREVDAQTEKALGGVDRARPWWWAVRRPVGRVLLRVLSGVSLASSSIAIMLSFSHWFSSKGSLRLIIWTRLSAWRGSRTIAGDCPRQALQRVDPVCTEAVCPWARSATLGPRRGPTSVAHQWQRKGFGLWAIDYFSGRLFSRSGRFNSDSYHAFLQMILAQPRAPLSHPRWARYHTSASTKPFWRHITIASPRTPYHRIRQIIILLNICEETNSGQHTTITSKSFPR